MKATFAPQKASKTKKNEGNQRHSLFGCIIFHKTYNSKVKGKIWILLQN